MSTKNSNRTVTTIAIVGMGAMGKGLLYQSTITPGIKCVAICDIDIRKCTDALEGLKLPFLVVTDLEGLRVASDKRVVAVCEDGRVIAEAEDVDVMIEATSSVGTAGWRALTALEHRKHVVLMNCEIDLIFGPFLSEIATRNGVVCTSCDGDQHGVLKHLIDDIRFWGFDLVMAGNIKGFLDRYANPTTIIPEANKRNLDYRMCTSYTDGTKLNIEMAIIANACGLETRTPGMLGLAMDDVKQVLDHFDFDRLWEDRTPFVDYILGAEPGGGVFAIGYCDDAYQKSMLSYYKMGSGPYYLFYRPYHLCHIEAMSTVLRAVSLDCFLRPDFGFQTNVIAYAKTDLRAGQSLDGIGGYTCFGKIENCSIENVNPGIPICLAHDIVLKHSIARDQRIRMEDIIYNPERYDFWLFHKAREVSERLMADKK
jgi:predicted homoserine dehydrogenase-like protein